MSRAHHHGRPRNGVLRQRPWRADGQVRERLDMVQTLMCVESTDHGMLKRLNEWAVSKGFDSISLSTLQRDRRRVFELWDERAGEHRDRYRELCLAELEELNRVLWHDYYRAAVNSMVRVRTAEAISANVERKAKIDGSWMQKQIEDVGMTLRDLLVTVCGEDTAEIVDMPRLLESNDVETAEEA